MGIRFKSGSLAHETDLCEPNLNLLAHAQAIELDIGSVCGGHGDCGRDRIRLPRLQISSFSPPSAPEREHLSPEELAQGIRLACQCFPQRPDLDVEIEVV